MLIDRSFQTIAADAYSMGPGRVPAAQRGRASSSKWAQGSGDGPIVAIATIALFIMTSLLATATLAQTLA